MNIASRLLVLNHKTISFVLQLPSEEKSNQSNKIESVYFFMLYIIFIFKCLEQRSEN